MRANPVALPFAVALLGIAVFSGMDAVMKQLSLSIGAYNALLWRTLVGALVGGLAFRLTRTAWPRPSVRRIHVVRGVLSAVMGMLFFWGLARVPLAQGIALSFVAPLIALYLAAIILKERIGRTVIMASLLGLAGVLVILAGQAQADLGREALRGSFAILASALLYAWNIILMRQQALVARPLEVAFFMSSIMGVCFLLPAPWLAQWPAAAHWPGIVGAAALAFASLMLLSWAYARAEAKHLAPVEYSGFVWASLLGLLFFSEPVRLLTLVGAAMIILACILAAPRAVSPSADPMGGS